MTVRIVRLGTPRLKKEGVRIGTVRRPPRGVPKRDFAKRDFYDAWLPQLSPDQDLVGMALKAQHAHDEKAWRAFTRKFRAEMKKPEAEHLLDLLAALSHDADFSVGCYCEDENWCHRSVLRQLLNERGAKIV